MSLPIKRKRGRPRHDEPREINDCDLVLIHEFKLRPAFYDRNHPQYRNRDFLEPLWVEMAEKLGYTVTSIKNRILQLRNRYNLEKRRIEQLQEQYQDADLSSQWLLYDSLSFLGDHIKTRRVFAKSLAAKQMQTKPPPASSSSTDGEEFDDPPPQFVNGNGASQPTMTNCHQIEFPQPSRSNNAGAPVMASSQYDARHTSQIKERNTLEASSNYSGVDKYKAFGQFLVSSLIELRENDALRLVERFTSDLVQTLLVEQKPMHESFNGDSVSVDK